MNIVEDSSIKRKFEAHFKGLKKSGFTEPRSFINDQVGFSVQRTYSNWPEVSLIKVALISNDDGSFRIYMDATFGELKDDAVAIRVWDDIDYRQPIDVQESGEYSYDLAQNRILKNGKAVSGVEIVNKFYKQHIKSTHYLHGMSLRLRLRFYQLFLKKLFESISELAKIFLWVLTGEKYKYDPFLPEEALDRLNNRPSEHGNFSNAKTINFFGYDAKRRTIVFYSYVHFIAFVLFYVLSCKPDIIKTILGNNFLTVIYVISSLAIVEGALPVVLKKIIKKSADISLNMSFKKVSIK